MELDDFLIISTLDLLYKVWLKYYEFTNYYKRKQMDTNLEEILVRVGWSYDSLLINAPLNKYK